MYKKIRLASLVIVMLTLVSCGTPTETKKEEPELFNGGSASSYSVVTDSETGCQYIETIEYSNGAGVSLTPRLNSEGNPICEK